MTGTKDKQKRLEDYSVAARAGATRSTLRQRMGNWPVYAAATGSALAMATGASADTIIAYMGAPVTVTVTGRGLSGKTVRVGTAPGFNIAVSHTTHQGLAIASLTGELGSQLKSGPGNPADLAFGAGVSGAAGVFGFGGPLGRWVPGVPGFEGFRFSAGGHENYGWAELKVGVDGGGNQDSVTLLGLAYNTSGASITAGELPAPSPEPGTAGLMLLALGAAGVTLLRKRKA